MDLLSALPEEVFEEIVSHLSGKDILNASLVSKRWYQMLGYSNDCMEKIFLKFTDANCNKDINPLLHSDRKYQNIRIEFDDKDILEVDVIKKIKAVFKKFSNSIVRLETSHDFQRVCELPKLKKLKCFMFLDFFLSGLLSSCHDLNKLEIHCYDLNIKHLKIIQNALENMKNLKKLYTDDVEILKNFRIERCNFRLEKFKREFNPVLEWTDISDFLKIHQSTLNYIKLDSFASEEVQFILTKLPNLQTLFFTIFRLDGEWDIPENSSIKKIIVSTSFLTKQEIMESDGQEIMVKIFSKLKNLQQIEIEALYPRYISAFDACKSLAMVKYEKLMNGLTEVQTNYLNNSKKIKFIHAKFPSCYF